MANDEIKTCPLCGGRMFWFPISNYWGCEKCKNTFNRYTVFPDEVKKKSVSAVGNAAAMCDIVTALAAVILPPRGKTGEDGWLAWVRAMQAKARAALAAPARNCDKYSHDEALHVWAAEKEGPNNGCFDEWLYHDATEGGAK